MRLGDAIAHFVVTLRDEHLRSHHTVDLYRRTLIAFAEAVGDLTVSRLGRGHVREHLVQMRDGHANSPATLRTKMAALRAFFNFLLQRGYRRTAPFLPEDFRIRVPRKVAASLTQDELDALLSAVDNGQGTTTRPPRGRASGLSPVLRDRILLFLLAGSGLRVAEATRLDLASVDAERKAIRVQGKGGVEREVFYDVEPLGPNGLALAFELAVDHVPGFQVKPRPPIRGLAGGRKSDVTKDIVILGELLRAEEEGRSVSAAARHLADRCPEWGITDKTIRQRYYKMKSAQKSAAGQRQLLRVIDTLRLIRFYSD